jgi:formyltetrahydrofolate synthetase
MIKYIIDIFFNTIEPVEAIPIEDEEVLIEKIEKEIINKNTLSISNEKNGKVIKSQTKKVLNAFKEIPSNIKKTYNKMKQIPSNVTSFITKTFKRTKVSGGKNTTRKLK